MGFKPGQSGNPNGRPKGSRNRASVEREAEIKAGGLAPLEYMLNLLRDETASKEDRMWAAEKAAPYVHPRLQSIAHTGGGGGLVEFVIRGTGKAKSADDWVEECNADRVPRGGKSDTCVAFEQP